MKKAIISLVFSLFILASYAQGIAGYLDSTFNYTGKLLVDIPNMTSAGGFAINDSPRKIAGVANTTNGICTFLLNDDGSLDLGFSSDGLDINSNTSGMVAVDICFFYGKILVLAYIPNSMGNLRILVYNLDGTLDNNYGGNGIITINTSNFDGEYVPTKMKAYYSNIYIMGTLCGFSTCSTFTQEKDGVILRLNATGNLDNTLSTDGIVTLGLIGYSDIVNDLVHYQYDQLLVACGNVRLNSTIGSLRGMLRNGDADLSFYGGSSCTVTQGNSSPASAVVHSASTNTCIAVGTTSNGGNKSGFAFGRTFNGQLNDSFNSGATLLSSETNKDISFQYIEELADGKYAIGGMHGTSSNNDFRVNVLDKYGAYYRSFSGDGILDIDFNGNNEKSTDMQLEDGKKIVLGGESRSSSTLYYALTRIMYIKSAPNSIEDIDGNPSFEILPNVIQKGNMANLVYSNNGLTEIMLFDETGKVVSKGNDLNTIEADIRALSAGVYFIKVTSSTSQKTKRLVVTE